MDIDISAFTKLDCQQALQQDPQNLAALVQLGILMREEGDLLGAEQQFQRFSQLLPDRSEPLLLLGQIAQLQDKHEQALQYYQQALAVEPQSMPALQALGLTFLLPQHFDPNTAELYFRQAIAADPECALNWQYLGRALLVSDPPAAVEPLLRCCDLDPMDAQSKFFAAIAHREVQQPKEALSLLQAAVRLEPDHANWWDALGCLYLDELNEPQAACSAFEVALGCPDVTSTYAQANYFWALLELGQWQRAQQLRWQLTGLEEMGYRLCDLALASLEHATNGTQIMPHIQAELELVTDDPDMQEEYAVDLRRLTRLLQSRSQG